MTTVEIDSGTGNGTYWARRYETCRSVDELLEALSEAIGSSASGLATTLQPRWYGDWACRAIRRFWPESLERYRDTHLRLLSESIVYVSRQLREFLSSSAFHDAEYVYRKVALGAGGVMANWRRFDDGGAESFQRVLSHVLLHHAHFPPEDDDAALIRLVASREQKLTVTQAVRFVTELVGSDPVSHAAPVTFVQRWVSLDGETWSEAASARTSDGRLDPALSS